jgi:hypothetical protein
MELTIEFKVNAALENAFIAHLRNVENGLGGEDKKSVEILRNEAERISPEEWSEELKNELGSFLLFQAGFQCLNGYEGDDWEE